MMTACLGERSRKLRLDFEASHFFHPDVENDERDGVRLHVGQEIRSGCGKPAPNPSEASKRPIDFRTPRSSSTRQTTFAAPVSVGVMRQRVTP